MALSSKDRLLGVLSGEWVDRPPVIIPGGMMAGTLYALLQGAGLVYPDIHTQKEAMTAYTRLLQEKCGIDNYGVPFCMTVEAEDFGASVDLGTPLKEPRVTRYIADTIEEVASLNPIACLRHGTTLRAIGELTGKDIPVIGNLTGPISLLSSLIEPTIIYRSMAKAEKNLFKALERVTSHIIGFAIEQANAGADALVVADPSASGEILGSDLFKRFAAPFLKEIVTSIKNQNKPAILHICGNTRSIAEDLHSISWDALSLDSVVNLRKMQTFLPGRTLMGNVSTHMLALSREDRIQRISLKIIETAGILSPACGLPTSTEPRNIRAMVRAAIRCSKNLCEKGPINEPVR